MLLVILTRFESVILVNLCFSFYSDFFTFALTCKVWQIKLLTKAFTFTTTILWVILIQTLSQRIAQTPNKNIDLKHNNCLLVMSGSYCPVNIHIRFHKLLHSAVADLVTQMVKISSKRLLSHKCWYVCDTEIGEEISKDASETENILRADADVEIWTSLPFVPFSKR